MRDVCVCVCVCDVIEVPTTVRRHLPSAFLCDKSGVWTLRERSEFPSPVRRITSAYYVRVMVLGRASRCATCAARCRSCGSPCRSRRAARCWITSRRPRSRSAAPPPRRCVLLWPLSRLPVSFVTTEPCWLTLLARATQFTRTVRVRRTAQQSSESAHTHSTGTAHTNRPTHTGLTDPRAGKVAYANAQAHTPENTASSQGTGGVALSSQVVIEEFKSSTLCGRQMVQTDRRPSTRRIKPRKNACPSRKSACLRMLASKHFSLV